MVHGTVSPGFEAVRQAFEANFTRRAELGAACAAYHQGEKVVDLWGGHRDREGRKLWDEDTMVMVFSTSKGMAATAVALAQSRGLLDYDATVSSYWPEFAQHGKGEITVRQLLAHQAGLCAIDERRDARKLANHDAVAAAMAAQRPVWEPGTRQGYHALSLGWYQSELIRRVDARRRSLGRFFAEEIAEPLGLEFHFGLPATMSPERIADITSSNLLGTLRHIRSMPPGMVAGLARRGSVTARVFGNPRLRSAADLDRPAYRALEIPSGGGIGLVRSVARVYGDLATGAHEVGISPGTLDELCAPARPPSGGRRDLVLTVPTSFSLGFVRPSPNFLFGSSERAFGHPGAGGSFGFADPDAGIGFAYAPNRLGHHLRDDPREKALRAALYSCI